MSSNKLCGELYLDDDDKPHFVCHTPPEMTFQEAHIALVGFRDLLQDQIDRQKECPHWKAA